MIDRDVRMGIVRKSYKGEDGVSDPGARVGRARENKFRHPGNRLQRLIPPLLLAILLWAPLVLAGSFPTASSTVNAESWLSQDFSFIAPLANSSDVTADVGRGSIIDRIFHYKGANTTDGIDFMEATHLGTAVTAETFTFPEDDGAGRAAAGCVALCYPIVTVTTTPPDTDSEERDESDVDDADSMDPPSIDVTKTAALAPDGDVDGSGSVSPGDMLRVTISVSNSGSVPITSVTMDAAPNANTTMNNGSVSAPDGIVVSGNNQGDDTVLVAFAFIAASATVTVVYDIAIDDPLPAPSPGYTTRPRSALSDCPTSLRRSF